MTKPDRIVVAYAYAVIGLGMVIANVVLVKVILRVLHIEF